MTLRHSELRTLEGIWRSLLGMSVSTAMCAAAASILASCAKSSANTSADSTSVVAVQNKVRETMKDPEAVRFRFVKMRVLRADTTVCGEFNAKNSYGGYIGYRPFVGLRTQTALATDTGFLDIDSEDAYRDCMGLPSIVSARAARAYADSARSDTFARADASKAVLARRAQAIKDTVRVLIDDGEPPFLGSRARKAMYSAFCSNWTKIPDADLVLLRTESVGLATGYKMVSDQKCGK